MQSYFPGDPLTGFPTTLQQFKIVETLSGYRLQRRLRGSLILFAPYAFVHSPSNMFSLEAFATVRPCKIKTFHRSPASTSSVSHSLELQYPYRFHNEVAVFKQGLTDPATDALNPIIIRSLEELVLPRRVAPALPSPSFRTSLPF